MPTRYAILPGWSEEDHNNLLVSRSPQDTAMIRINHTSFLTMLSVQRTPPASLETGSRGTSGAGRNAKRHARAIGQNAELAKMARHDADTSSRDRDTAGPMCVGIGQQSARCSGKGRREKKERKGRKKHEAQDAVHGIRIVSPSGAVPAPRLRHRVTTPVWDSHL